MRTIISRMYIIALAMLGVLWIGLALTYGIRFGLNGGYAIMPAAMILNAMAYGLAAVLARRRNSLVRAGILLLLLVNLILTVTDQAGFWDWLSLGLNLAAGIGWILTVKVPKGYSG